MKRFIDTHVHFYSCEKGDLDKVAKWMKANNIQLVINNPLEPTRPKNDSQRQQMLENYSKYKGRIERFCIIKPHEVSTLEETVEILQQEIKDGAIGFGEHYGENLNFDAPENMMLYAACNQVSLPVMFHIDRDRNRDEKGLPGLQNVLKTYPELILIAHSSGWWKHLEDGTCGELLQKYPNLYADISCSMKQPLIRENKFAKDFMTRNADKLLFGSDTTSNSFQKVIHPEFALFDELNLPKEIEAKILRENTLKLFKISN